MITLIAAIAIAPTVVVERLANGATIVAIHIPDSRAFSAQTFLRAGSAYESAEESGVSHLLEHLLFVDGEGDKIAENAGILLNATTYREFMRLHAVGQPGSWKQGVEAVGKLLRKPAEDYIAAEWAVIGQENTLALLDPDEAVHREIWQSAALGSPWALLPMGSQSNPAPASVERAYGRFVRGANIVAVVAGSQGTSESLAALRTHYAAHPSGPPEPTPPLPSWKPPLKGAHGDRYGVATPIAGYDAPAAYLAAEVAAEALISPARLLPLGLEAKSFLTPSSRGSMAVLSFAASDGAPGLALRVARSLGRPISEAEFADAKARVRLRYSEPRPVSISLVTGLAHLFIGKQIDFAAEVDKLAKTEVDAIVAEFAK